MCRVQQEKGLWAGACQGVKWVEACPRAWVPNLAPENKRFWELFTRIMPGLFDGFGGVQYQAITEVLDLFGVPAGQRVIIHDKCLLMIKIWREVKEAERKNG